MAKDTPVIVWTMGKVGTSTVSRALKRAGIPTLHVHSIRPSAHSAVIKARESSPELSQGSNIPHIAASLEAMEIISGNARPVKIISMVREPISRNISAFFQNLGIRGLGPDSPTAELIEVFKSCYPHNLPLVWFDRELKDGVGFDVFAHKFDREARLARYSQGRFDVLIMRIDAELPRQQAEVSDFVGSPVSLTVENTAEAKQYADSYKAFKEQISLDNDYVQRMYSSKLAKHFWTDVELDQLATNLGGK